MQPNEKTQHDFTPKPADVNYFHYLISRKLHDEAAQEYRKEWHIIKVAKQNRLNFEKPEAIATNGFSDIILIWDADKQVNPQAKEGNFGGGKADGGETIEVLYRKRVLSLTKQQMFDICDKEGIRVNKNNIGAKKLAERIKAELGDLDPEE